MLGLFAPSEAIQKTLRINRKTGIQKRPTLCSLDHPFYASATPPSITEVSEHFLARGVPLAAAAASQALGDAGLTAMDVTHVVCTTVTDSSNPGYDLALVSHLGIQDNGVERYLLAGVGCAGGLAALRTASNIALAAHACGRKAVVLVVATEVVSPFPVMEFANAEKTGQVNLGVSLFSDCSSALVLTVSETNSGVDLMDQYSGTDELDLDIPGAWSPSSTASDLPSPIDGPFTGSMPDHTTSSFFPPKPIYRMYAFTNWTVPNTSGFLRYDVNPHGWTLTLSPKMPDLTASVIMPTLTSLLAAAGLSHLHPADVDWAVHPGGAAILKICAGTLGLVDEDHLRASWGVYTQRGNSSSATVLSVLKALRGGEHAAAVIGAGVSPMAENSRGREWVIAVSFGPGVTIEMAILRRVGYE
jgi:type III polyketide synthase